MQRRDFLIAGLAAALATSIRAADGRSPRILLRSSWQTENIGDIAHTPGVLALLEKYLPDAAVKLWPSSVGNGVQEMLQRRFPKVEVVRGSQAQLAAFAWSDFLLHGSGPSLVAQKDVVKWMQATNKPFGVYGITLQMIGDETKAVLDKARFVYCRDSVSLQLAKERRVASPILGFAPDGAFAVDLRDDAKATKFLADHDLVEGQFLCCIPRLRNTPYWSIPAKNVSIDAVKHARNEKMKEHDHAPLREAITEIVRRSPMKVLICPEDQTQMAVGKAMLYEPLPDDVKKRIVLRENYWLTDEALSTYVRSAGLFGNEMHSPIMCIGNGIPAIVCRWAEQTSKGFMWRDIGLGEWLFDLDVESDLQKVAPAALQLALDPAGAKAKALAARERVRAVQSDTLKSSPRS